MLSSIQTLKELQAAGGIGQGAANALAGAGASAVVFADIDGQRVQNAAEESKKYAINPRYQSMAIQVDITDSISVQNMVDEVVKKFKRIDYLVNSAGVL